MQLGGEQAEFLDGAADGAGVDVVADAEGTQPQQHHAGGDVRQCALHGEADGEAGGAECGENAGGLDADLAEHGHQHHDQDAVAHDRGDHAAQHRVDAGLPCEEAHGCTLGAAGEPPAQH